MIRSVLHARFVPPSEHNVPDGRLTLTVSPIAADCSRPRTKGALFGDDAVEDGRKEHQVHELRIELCSASGRDDLRCRRHAATVSVATIVRHSVECIGEHNDASRHWNTAAAEAIRISRAVPPLVVRENARGKVRVEGRNWREHVGATLRVRGYRPPFRGGEMRVLVNDVEERFVNLPNVMEQRHALDDFPSVGTELGGVGDDQGVGGDATHVCAGLRVIRVDCIEQRFQAGGGKSLRRRSTAAFSYEERTARNAGEDG